MASHFENYPYVDGYYENPQTRHSTPWVRVLARDLDRAVITPSMHSNCYASIQRFKDATSNRDGGRKSKAPGPILGDPDEPDNLPDQQMHYHGLFFDFDCKAKENNITEEEALERSRKDAARLADFFMSKFSLNAPYVQAWFSGRKGFHVTVRPECFDIRPHRHLTYVMQKAALELVHQLDLVTLDRSVYTLPRMWRIPNTIHVDTGRYKIELTARELGNMSITDIVELSKKPRGKDAAVGAPPFSHIYSDDEYENIIAEPDSIAWWSEFCGLYETIREMKNNIPRKLIVIPAETSDYPACMRDMLDNGCKRGGPGRNRSLIPMAAFLKDAGTERDEARRIIKDWTNTHFGSDDTDAGRQRLANGKSVVDSVYRGAIYSFSCRSILSNSGPTADAKVACVGQQKCAWIGKPEDQESAELPLLHLSEASKGCYLDKKVRLPVHVSGIAGNPFGLPIKGEATCTPDITADICQPCPMLTHKGRMVWSFGADDRDTLKLIDVNDPRRRSTIKAKLDIPIKCFKHKITTIEKGNIEELQIIPMVDYSQVYMEDLSGNSDNDINRKAARHVVRRAFHLGHGVVSNKKYIIEASVFEHPEDQRIVYLFDKMEPAQNDIDQFEMTPELLAQLRLFQPREGQSVDDKMTEIHSDFEANVHNIGGRHDLAIGFDLCYHSVISFKFIGKPLAKGWFELLVLGDSGTGKGGRPQDGLLTPSGWSTYGDIKEGDSVIGSDGQSHRVTGVFRRGRLPMYRVRFRDQAEVVVSGDHLWSVGNQNWERDGHSWKTRTTDQLREAGLFWPSQSENAGPLGKPKFWIPTVAPVQFTSCSTLAPIDPWLLGVLLGDGCLCDNALTFSNPEEDLLERVRASLPQGDEVVHQSRVTADGLGWRINGGKTKTVLRDLGLEGTRSGTKFVPQRYLWGSVEERLAVLQGLCDTDGHVDTSGKRIDYVTVSRQLAADVLFLVRSLGGHGTIVEKETGYTYKGENRSGQLAYRIGIHMPPGMVPVTTEKHLAKWEGKDRRYLRTIESIEAVGEDECICIKVDAPDELYVTDHFVVTHNTTMIQRMMKHYGLGELIAGEESKRTGLVYASVQMAGQWFVQWGKIPQNDRRLLIIDEFHSIPPDEVGKMTQLRSSGLAQCGGVNSAYETFARTRMILLANSRSGRALSEFNYGIEAVRDLYEAVEDCRRVDMALVVRADDVPKSMRNKRWDNSDIRHVYTADLCSKLVLWAWSRDPQHVEWADGAEDEVIRHANILADTYECDIPIAQPSDLREKIARISAAVAARLFSTDNDARKLFIQKEHVAYAAQYMDTAYRKPAMAYFEYARMYKNQNNMTAERRAAVRAFLLKQEDSDNLIAMLGTVNYLTKNELGDMTSYDKDDLNKVWKFLVANQLVRKTARGYRKTPAFTELLKGIGSKRSGYGHSPASVTLPPSSPKLNGTAQYHAPPSSSVSEDLVDSGEDPPY